MRHRLVRPTEAEEAAINAGIADDGDTYELTPAEFKQLRPVRGRPRSEAPKQRITIRLSPDVLARTRSLSIAINSIRQDAARDGAASVSKAKRSCVGATAADGPSRGTRSTSI